MNEQQYILNCVHLFPANAVRPRQQYRRQGRIGPCSLTSYPQRIGDRLKEVERGAWSMVGLPLLPRRVSVAWLHSSCYIPSDVGPEATPLRPRLSRTASHTMTSAPLCRLNRGIRYSALSDDSFCASTAKWHQTSRMPIWTDQWTVAIAKTRSSRCARTGPLRFVVSWGSPQSSNTLHYSANCANVYT